MLPPISYALWLHGQGLTSCLYATKVREKDRYLGLGSWVGLGDRQTDRQTATGKILCAATAADLVSVFSSLSEKCNE